MDKNIPFILLITFGLYGLAKGFFMHKILTVGKNLEIYAPCYVFRSFG